MRRKVFALLTGVLVSVAGIAPDPAVAAAHEDVPYGFLPANAASQLDLEGAFDKAIDPREMEQWLKRLSSAPNQVGSPHDEANSQYILGLFRSWGWDAHIETFNVLYPTPKEISLEMVSPRHYKARLHEPPIAGDQTSADAAGALPPYNIYGGDGDVTGELVYVNYGMPGDYEDLARRGIDVKGRIVIARYGGGWRGLKPKLAQEHGAIGCIIYSDPRNDGYWAGDTYPAGGGRPAGGVQRGSVQDMSLYTGDPLTPGVGATADARRLDLSAAKSVMKIPVLPISYADATPLLRALAGPRAPEGWRGALPFTYHIGPGPARVHLKVENNWTMKPVHDVIAQMTGAKYPDQWVVRGNHFDAWVFGAHDPLSGTVALLAEAKAIGELAKKGWKPQRTLVYATWDGEEPATLGSTEWVETHADELRHKAVLYINSDENARGFLWVGGSHAYQHFVNGVAADVTDPQTGVSVLQRARARALVAAVEKGATGEQKEYAKRVREGDLPIRALGSGSDFTAFLEHLGIASIFVGFSGDRPGGDYHSAYDTFDHYINIDDPGLAYGKTLASTAGRMVLRAADADLLPVRFGDVAATVARYLDQVRKLADGMREQTNELDRLLDEHAFEDAIAPWNPVGPPKRESSVPYLDFAPVQNALVDLQRSAVAFDKLFNERMTSGKLTAEQAAAVNAILQSAEQSLTDARGLPGRPWYRHMIYAAGALTGYGAKTLPAIRESIEERRWGLVDGGVSQTAMALEAYRTSIDRATAALR